jgi:hypothetical protein
MKGFIPLFIGSVIANSGSTSTSAGNDKLIKVFVNSTDLEPVPCLRAEFKAKTNISGEIIELSSNVTTDGSDCGKLVINDIITKIKLVMDFNNNSETEDWELAQLSVTKDQSTFTNNTIEDVKAPLKGTYGQSFLCTAGFTVDLNQNGTSTPNWLQIERFQVQPFKVPEDTYANPVICKQDISVVIPAIVGSILALLVILVLITYAIGRRRTRIAYQEI